MADPHGALDAGDPAHDVGAARRRSASGRGPSRLRCRWCTWSPAPRCPRRSGGCTARARRPGRAASGRCSASPSSAAKQAGESKRGRHSQSTEPSLADQGGGAGVAEHGVVLDRQRHGLTVPKPGPTPRRTLVASPGAGGFSLASPHAHRRRSAGRWPPRCTPSCCAAAATVATAESLTGGALGDLLSAAPGASDDLPGRRGVLRHRRQGVAARGLRGDWCARTAWCPRSARRQMAGGGAAAAGRRLGGGHDGGGRPDRAGGQAGRHRVHRGRLGQRGADHLFGPGGRPGHDQDRTCQEAISAVLAALVP